MAKETEPKTYRVSPEVDSELRRLAKIHGGVDKALRVVFNWAHPLGDADVKRVGIEELAQRPNSEFKVAKFEGGKFKGTLLKPKERSK